MDYMLLLSFVGVLLGLVGIWKAGDWVVYYAVQIGDILNVTPFFVGFFILAIAAALPDLSVAIASALSGACEVSAGDIVGANVTDVALVLGAMMAIAGSIYLPKYERDRFVWIVMISGLLMSAMFVCGQLSSFHGWFLIACYLVSMAVAWYTRVDDHHEEAHDIPQADSVWYTACMLAVSFAGIFTSSWFVVQCAVSVAARCYLPLESIGGTIVAIGTTLPEIILSYSALKRKQYSLAFGSTLGTVLEQVTLILGILAILSDKPINLRPLWGASTFMFASFIILVYSLFRQRLERRTGFALLGLFAVYLAYHFVPQGPWLG